MAVPRIKLGSEGFEVSAQGLGCMGMSAFYGPPKSEHEMISLIHHAVSKGITFLDTADLYGPYTNEILLGKALSLEQLLRIDNTLPIEVTIGELKKLVKEGKIKYIGLSEASASAIRRAHVVHPITAVQIEWSLWSRDVAEETIPTCRELGIGIVVYSPLGRGFLSSRAKIIDNLADNDSRKMSPRFTIENLERNKAIFEKLSTIALKKGCTPGQLALAWVHHQGNDVVPIPGTTKVKNLEENIDAITVKLTTSEMKEIETIISSNGVYGNRYNDELINLTWMYSETPPLSSWNKI